MINRDPQSLGSKMVTWNDGYITGIKLIDDQHKEMVQATNELYDACTRGPDEALVCFKKTIQMMVNHTKEIFAHEEDLFDLTAYPDAATHKLQHKEFIKAILEHGQKLSSGARFVPNAFVRYLGEWVSSHIALEDKKFGIYYAEKIDEMKITAQQMQKLLSGVKKFKLLAFSMLLTHLKEMYAKDSSEITINNCVQVINAFLGKNRKIMAADYVIIKSL
ncbi:MAG: bacteriohemerythrin [Treponema sp.]|nr:bacteriohemerythrin [Treponema sp.]